MRVSQAKELFRSLAQSYFGGAGVIFSNQSRAAKTALPLVTITPGNVRRHTHPVYTMAGDEPVGCYQSRISMTVDLFTHGAPVLDDETGETVGTENTAMDDILSFADFLGSDYVVDWCSVHDVAIAIDGDAQDLTGQVNDNNYEFRARLIVVFHFTQKTVGRPAVLLEESIQYPTGESDPETGEPVYTPEKPKPTESIVTSCGPAIEIDDSVVIPQFEQTPSGGGTEVLAQEEAGYFTEVEIKEEIGNE